MTLPAGRALLVATTLLAAVLAGCGDDDFGAPPSRSPSPTAAPSEPAEPTFSALTPTASPQSILYTVQAGDTLSSIAQMFGVTTEALLQANDISDPDSLQVGQVLVISGGSAVPSATPPSSGAPSDSPTQGPGDGEVGLLELVDKQNALPAGYVPPNLVALSGAYVAPGYSANLQLPAHDAGIELMDAALAAGYDIRVVSGYRSYAEQITTFDYWVSVLGYEAATRVSAMAGHSEHQLGTTVDFGSSDLGWSLTEGFGATPAGQWLAAHAHEFGYALSYPEGQEQATGYSYEPWHFRYIGVDAATGFVASGQTLNQYLAQFN